MKDTDFNKLIETKFKGGWVPNNQLAHDLANSCNINDITYFKEVGNRELKFHQCYFSLLNYIYKFLPVSFCSKVSKPFFYIFLKHLAGKYKVLFSFKDGTKLVQYESISFDNLSQNQFEDYIKEQLPFIYEYVIAEFYEGLEYDKIIQQIEIQYIKFLSKL